MLFMVKKVAEVLVENLKVLDKLHQEKLGSQPKIAKEGGVGQRTVGRALKGEVSPRLTSLDGFAKAFNVQPWQLLHPTLGRVPPNEANDPLLYQLINFYGQLDFDNRDKLLSEANWLYSKQHPDKSHATPFPKAKPVRTDKAKERS